VYFFIYLSIDILYLSTTVEVEVDAYYTN